MTRSSQHATGPRRTQSLQRAVEILRALADRPAGVPVTGLAAVVGLPVPTARRLLATLADARLAERVPDDGRWVLGHELIRLGRAADPYAAVVARARPVLQRLADEVGEAALLGASRLPHGVDVILQVDVPQLVGVGSWVGRSFGLHASAGARLALACLPDDEVLAILGPGPFHRYTSATIVEAERCLEEVRRVRETGVAVSVDELEEGLTTVAVPVGPIGPACTFGVGVSGPTFRLPAGRREALVPTLRASADALAAAIAAP